MQTRIMAKNVALAIKPLLDDLCGTSFQFVPMASESIGRLQTDDDGLINSPDRLDSAVDLILASRVAAFTILTLT